MKRTRNDIPLSTQMKRRKIPVKKNEFEGNTELMISTGSTLLDLAISGGRKKGGGIPGGVLVEIFGPSSSGKTVLLCEIAGNVQSKGGEVQFHDTEARLNKQFAKLFGLKLRKGQYTKPNEIPEVFEPVRNWKVNTTKVNGIFTDSLAALSTDLEMEKDEGDKMGMRRAKLFSEQLRKTCRILSMNNYIMVCSNQVRVNANTTWGAKYYSPGGEAIGFYSTIRLRTYSPEKIKKVKKINGKEVTKIVGVNIEIEVFKNSAWKPYRTAPLTILFDYGIDDIRQNLQFIKNYTKNTIYTVRGENISKSMDDAITYIEKNNIENELKEETIELWEEIEKKFDSNRKRKVRE